MRGQQVMPGKGRRTDDEDGDADVQDEMIGFDAVVDGAPSAYVARLSDSGAVSAERRRQSAKIQLCCVPLLMLSRVQVRRLLHT